MPQSASAIAQPARSGGEAAPDIGLFDRIPEGLFAPLASPNRRLYWAEILRLYERYFGPDAEPGDEDGYRQSVIVADLERFIVENRDWHDEDGETEATTVNARAHNHLRRLMQAGWIREERRGLRTYLSMRPNVIKFLEELKRFGEEGPRFIGGKVQTIHAVLQQIVRAPADGAPGFHEAARDARELISLISSTSVRVREVMERLSVLETPAAYVEAFFREYVTRLFIGDYQELFTRNHPLRRRHDILDLVGQLRDEPALRSQLFEGYVRHICGGDRATADASLDRDFERLGRFSDIDRYLNRLQASVSRATRQAVSYLHYRLNTQGDTERMLRNAVEAVVAAAPHVGGTFVTAWAMGEPFTESQLRPPRVQRPPRPRTIIDKRELTTRQRALQMLNRALVRQRQVSPELVRAYLAEQQPNARRISSDNLRINSVRDLVMVLALHRITAAAVRAGPGQRVGEVTAANLLRDHRFEVEHAETDNAFLRFRRFTIIRSR